MFSDDSRAAISCVVYPRCLARSKQAAKDCGSLAFISAIIVAIFDRMLFAAAEAGVANPAVSAAVAKPTVSTVVMARKIVRMTFSSEWRSQPFCDAIDNCAQSWRGVK